MTPPPDTERWASSRTRAVGLAQRGRRKLARTSRAAAQRVRSRKYERGLLSLVVPAYGVEDYIGECLDSLRKQRYDHIEIIVVDDGSPDRSREIAEEHAAEDSRVRVVTRPNGGLSAARNTGVEHARGEFLAFIDSDDVVSAQAFAPSVQTLQESGSDFAITSYDRLKRGLAHPAGWWIKAAHARERIGTNLDEYPEIQVNAVAWSKVYRRSFYDSAELHFPEGVLYEDQPVSARAFARARAFDVHPHIGVHWRMRDNRSSISQQSGHVRNLVEHTKAVRSGLDELLAAGHKKAAGYRRAQVLQHNLPLFAMHLPKRDPEYAERLIEAVDMLLDEVNEERYRSGVLARQKALWRLVTERRIDDAIDLLQTVMVDGRHYRTEVTPLGVVSRLPVPNDIEDRDLILSERQLRLRSSLRYAGWRSPGRLSIAGWTFVENLSLADTESTLRIELVSDRGHRIDLPITRTTDHAADIVGEHLYCDYRSAGFEAEIDVTALPDGPRRWFLEASLTVGEIARQDRVRILPRTEAAGRAAQIPEAGVAYVVERGQDSEFVINVLRQQQRVVSREVTGSGQESTVTLEAITDRIPSEVVSAPLSDPGRTTSATVTTLGGGRWRASFPASAFPIDEKDQTVFQVQANIGNKLVTLLDVPEGPDRTEGLGGDDPVAALGFVRGPQGALRVIRRRRAAAVRDAHFDGDVFRASLRLIGFDPDTATPRLVSHRDAAGGTLTPGADGWYDVSIPMVAARAGHAPAPLAPAKFDLFISDDAGDVAALPTAAQLAELPFRLDLPSSHVRVEIPTGADPRALRLTVSEPVPFEFQSLRAQRELREQARVEVADRDAIFFRCLYGEVAHGNGLGVHEELRRRGSHLELIWSVAHHGVHVPEGATALIEKTPAWHQAIARSRYHMVDVHQLDWFRKPQGQSIIQTMHGYPYKVMGHGWWAKGDFPLPQIASFDRRARDWDYFVSPATYATPLLEAAFLAPAGATPEILEIGYPRNDVLLSDRADEVRRSTRELLGIAPDKVVVMYGPTFRDYLTNDDMTAVPVNFFDPDEAADALGDDYVFLIRGHAFNARAEGERIGRAGHVIDVTDYPDVNDLILASDAAVLDYSSLRFDYALTGKPMVFLVPDLAAYDAARGGVIPYAPTAPGPHTESTGETVEHLRDLDRLRTQTAEQRARFISEYADLDDGHAGARLVDAVMVPRGDAPA